MNEELKRFFNSINFSSEGFETAYLDKVVLKKQEEINSDEKNFEHWVKEIREVLENQQSYSTNDFFDDIKLV